MTGTVLWLAPAVSWADAVMLAMRPLVWLLDLWDRRTRGGGF